MNRQTGTTERRDASVIAGEARELFARWAAEEEAGYEGEISWEAFKQALNEERPDDGRPFPESS
ncbi:MAG: hypothetical protein H0T74_05260 [Rubrobacteraceae bacterium]|nr:hypothetical protein [Rubrobacteraceae bacterium]